MNNVREKLIQAFKENFDPNNIKNASIKLKLAVNIPVCTSDENFKDGIAPVKVDGYDYGEYNFGNTYDEIVESAEKFNLIGGIIPHEDNTESFVAGIPEGSIVEVYMDVEDELSYTENVDENYIAGSFSIKYNGIIVTFESMDAEFFEGIFED